MCKYVVVTLTRAYDSRSQWPYGITLQREDREMERTPLRRRPVSSHTWHGAWPELCPVSF